MKARQCRSQAPIVPTQPLPLEQAATGDAAQGIEDLAQAVDAMGRRFRHQRQVGRHESPPLYFVFAQVALESRKSCAASGTCSTPFWGSASARLPCCSPMGWETGGSGVPGSSEFVTSAGLSPRAYESGSSVRARPQMSKVGHASLVLLFSVQLPLTKGKMIQ